MSKCPQPSGSIYLSTVRELESLWCCLSTFRLGKQWLRCSNGLGRALSPRPACSVTWLGAFSTACLGNFPHDTTLSSVDMLSWIMFREPLGFCWQQRHRRIGFRGSNVFANTPPMACCRPIPNSIRRHCEVFLMNQKHRAGQSKTPSAQPIR